MIVAFSALFIGYVACDNDNPGPSVKIVLVHPGGGMDSIGNDGGGTGGGTGTGS